MPAINSERMLHRVNMCTNLQTARLAKSTPCQVQESQFAELASLMPIFCGYSPHNCHAMPCKARRQELIRWWVTTFAELPILTRNAISKPFRKWLLYKASLSIKTLLLRWDNAEECWRLLKLVTDCALQRIVQRGNSRAPEDPRNAPTDSVPAVVDAAAVLRKCKLVQLRLWGKRRRSASHSLAICVQPPRRGALTWGPTHWIMGSIYLEGDAKDDEVIREVYRHK